MKIDCDVTRDLMPLVVDGTASMKSCTLVDEHVAKCEPCRVMLEEMRQEVETGASAEQAGRLVKKLHRRRLLRRALLVLLGMVLCAVLLVAGWRGWNYYYNDFCVLTAAENYSITLFPQDIYGVADAMMLLDGHKQMGNSYFDQETGDLYMWSTTTRRPWPAKSEANMYANGDLYYFDDIGYAYMVLVKDEEAGVWRTDVMPVKRILKGAPEGFEGADGSYTVMFELENPPDEALKEIWRERLEAWNVDFSYTVEIGQ